MPAEWRAFYGLCNGVDLFKGNVRLGPLFGDYDALINASTFLRDANWLVPDELWIVGDNGRESYFGLWLPAATAEVGPVVEMGEIFEPGCLAIAGSSLSTFLLHRTVYYLLSFSDQVSPDAALDVLNVPLELRSKEPEYDKYVWTAVARWARRLRQCDGGEFLRHARM